MKRGIFRVVSLLMLVVSLLAPIPGNGQTSIPTLVTQLQNGPVSQRNDAAARLRAIGPQSLPAAAQAALITELNRINSLLLLGQPVPNADAADPESVGEYYLELVSAVAAIRTSAAYQALIPAVGVSGGVARRVARLGDAAVPALADLIRRGYESDRAIATLGLVWLWSDSTGSPLSDASRAIIVSTFTSAATSGDWHLRLGLSDALRLAKDPTFTPLARHLASIPSSDINSQIVAQGVAAVTIPTLTSAGTSYSPATLATGLLRATQAICNKSPAAATSAACMLLLRQTSVAVLLVGQQSPLARNRLQGVINGATQAYTSGVITQIESTIITGAAQQLIGRLP
jgi:hypothetical protein